VLDGLDLAARAVGARRRIICVARGQAEVYESVRAALGRRGDRAVEIVLTPQRYISGQETALVDFIDGGPGRPTLSRPFETGVGGAPTLVDNVETLAHVALIARHGADAWRPGPALVTVAGAVRAPGVREVVPGDSLREILRDAGSARPRGVLLGGYYGRWIPGSAVDTVPVEPASMGAGVIAVVDDSSCAVAELARVAAWYAASSAGQCGACTWGLRDLAGATAAVHVGRRADRALADIRRWTPMVRGRGACRLPDGAAGFLESGIEVFADEIAAHESGAGCGRTDNHLLPAPAPEAW
jgi:NADH:ubiquinone oxidoreductase subunit F (NADH-binding)